MRWLVMAAVVSAGPAGGQVIDDSAKEISKARTAEAIQRIRAQLNDPSSLQMRSIWLNKRGSLCGLYNARTVQGGYGPFNPFADTAAETILAPDSSDEKRAEKMKQIAALCLPRD